MSKISCLLEPLGTHNDSDLYSLLQQHGELYTRTVSIVPIPQTLDQFRELLKSCFESGRIEQFIIYSQGSPVGTTYIYREEDLIQLSGMFSPSKHKTRVPFLGFVLTIEYAHIVLSINEISFSVYSDNLPMLSIASKVGILEKKYLSNYSKRHALRYTISQEKISWLISLKDRMLS